MIDLILQVIVFIFEKARTYCIPFIEKEWESCGQSISIV